MGGGQKTTSSSNFSPQDERLKAAQATAAESVGGPMTDYIQKILRGDTSGTSGYASSMKAPVESATSKAIEGILTRTPRGGMQTQMIEQARMQGGLKMAETEQDYIQKALQMAASLFGYQPSASSTTQKSSQGVGAGDVIGPVLMAGTITAAAI